MLELGEGRWRTEPFLLRSCCYKLAFHSLWQIFETDSFSHEHFWVFFENELCCGFSPAVPLTWQMNLSCGRLWDSSHGSQWVGVLLQLLGAGSLCPPWQNFWRDLSATCSSSLFPTQHVKLLSNPYFNKLQERADPSQHSCKRLNHVLQQRQAPGDSLVNCRGHRLWSSLSPGLETQNNAKTFLHTFSFPSGPAVVYSEWARKFGSGGVILSDFLCWVCLEGFPLSWMSDSCQMDASIDVEAGRFPFDILLHIQDIISYKTYLT